MPSTSYSTPAVTSATSGSMNSGMPGVVCSAMAVHTRRMLSSGTPWPCRKWRGVAGLVGAVHLEAAAAIAELCVQAEVVEHRPDVQQFGVEAEAAVAALQAAPPEDPAGVVIHQVAGAIPDQLGG